MFNIENIDGNECFKWCLVRYLHSADHNSRRIRKVDRDFAREFDFKDVAFPVKIRDIHKIEKKKKKKKKKKIKITIVFLVMKTK